MDSNVLEVSSAVVHTPEGESIEVQGGAYLSPEAFLTTSAELSRLRERAAETTPVVGLLLSAALVGLAAGYWLGRRD
jgi:hypothetical protein